MYILDTMLVSYILREDALQNLYQKELETEAPLYISVQTLGGLFYGAEAKGWGKPRRQKLDDLISEYTILPITASVAMPPPIKPLIVSP